MKNRPIIHPHRHGRARPTHPYAFLDHVVRVRLELDLQFGPFRHILLGYLVDPGSVHDHDIPSRG